MTHDSKTQEPNGLGLALAHALRQIVEETGTMSGAERWARSTENRLARRGSTGIPLDALARSRDESNDHGFPVSATTGAGWGIGSAMHVLAMVLDGTAEVLPDGRVRLTAAELERRAEAARMQRKRDEETNARRAREAQARQLEAARARSIGADGEGREYIDVAAAFGVIPAAFSRSTGVLVLGGTGVSCIACGAKVPYKTGDVGLRLPHTPTCAALPALAHYGAMHKAMLADAAV